LPPLMYQIDSKSIDRQFPKSQIDFCLFKARR
jgi:hypothetical protein